MHDVLKAFAAGDAFGAFYEFAPRTTEIPNILMHKEGWPFGGVSDDTLLTLLTLEASQKQSPEAGAEEFKKLLQESIPKLRGLGPTTRSALGLPVKPHELNQVGKTNGAMMRCALLGLYFAGEELDSWVRALAQVTHKEELAIESAVVMARVFSGESFPNYREWDSSIDVSNDSVETLRAVMWVSDRAESTNHAYRLACSLGGDTDTVSALAGALVQLRLDDDLTSIPWFFEVDWSEIS